MNLPPSIPDSSVFSINSAGELILTLHGITFPVGGGAQSGTSFCQFNFSDHIPPAHSPITALVTGCFVGAWIVGPIMIAAAAR